MSSELAKPNAALGVTTMPPTTQCLTLVQLCSHCTEVGRLRVARALCLSHCEYSFGLELIENSRIAVRSILNIRLCVITMMYQRLLSQ